MIVRIFFPVILASLMLFLTNPVLAEESNEETNNNEEVFQSLDKDKDGKICREEWETVDKDKDNTICKDEWKRWEFKTEEKPKGFDLQWYDNNGDGFMDQEEFYRYPRPRL
jgi:Ca2+-binding EF-hand superfamily protein